MQVSGCSSQVVMDPPCWLGSLRILMIILVWPHRWSLGGHWLSLWQKVCPCPAEWGGSRVLGAYIKCDKAKIYTTTSPERALQSEFKTANYVPPYSISYRCVLGHMKASWWHGRLWYHSPHWASKEDRKLEPSTGLDLCLTTWDLTEWKEDGHWMSGDCNSENWS